ncbi:hypothetical protein AYI70_g12210 [Smittium culicis]|uniref:Uncharacterized protein n=1 Tax=Smittium culicis TaxID=133412 RepID=A0A1R1WYF4_9FUNG|nr:hypothetical protein AYI70_g12210 [Smittium culicis]
MSLQEEAKKFCNKDSYSLTASPDIPNPDPIPASPILPTPPNILPISSNSIAYPCPLPNSVIDIENKYDLPTTSTNKHTNRGLGNSCDNVSKSQNLLPLDLAPNLISNPTTTNAYENQHQNTTNIQQFSKSSYNNTAESFNTNIKTPLSNPNLESSKNLILTEKLISIVDDVNSEYIPSNDLINTQDISSSQIPPILNKNIICTNIHLNLSPKLDINSSSSAIKTLENKNSECIQIYDKKDKQESLVNMPILDSNTKIDSISNTHLYQHANDSTCENKDKVETQINLFHSESQGASPIKCSTLPLQNEVYSPHASGNLELPLKPEITNPFQTFRTIPQSILKITADPKIENELILNDTAKANTAKPEISSNLNLQVLKLNYHSQQDIETIEIQNEEDCYNVLSNQCSDHLMPKIDCNACTKSPSKIDFIPNELEPVKINSSAINEQTENQNLSNEFDKQVTHSKNEPSGLIRNIETVSPSESTNNEPKLSQELFNKYSNSLIPESKILLTPTLSNSNSSSNDNTDSNILTTISQIAEKSKDNHDEVSALLKLHTPIHDKKHRISLLYPSDSESSENHSQKNNSNLELDLEFSPSEKDKFNLYSSSTSEISDDLLFFDTSSFEETPNRDNIIDKKNKLKKFFSTSSNEKLEPQLVDEKIGFKDEERQPGKFISPLISSNPNIFNDILGFNSSTIENLRSEIYPSENNKSDINQNSKIQTSKVPGNLNKSQISATSQKEASPEIPQRKYPFRKRTDISLHPFTKFKWTNLEELPYSMRHKVDVGVLNEPINLSAANKRGKHNDNSEYIIPNEPKTPKKSQNKEKKSKKIIFEKKVKKLLTLNKNSKGFHAPYYRKKKLKSSNKDSFKPVNKVPKNNIMVEISVDPNRKKLGVLDERLLNWVSTINDKSHSDENLNSENDTFSMKSYNSNEFKLSSNASDSTYKKNIYNDLSDSDSSFRSDLSKSYNELNISKSLKKPKRVRVVNSESSISSINSGSSAILDDPSSQIYKQVPKKSAKKTRLTKKSIRGVLPTSFLRGLNIDKFNDQSNKKSRNLQKKSISLKTKYRNNQPIELPTDLNSVSSYISNNSKLRLDLSGAESIDYNSPTSYKSNNISILNLNSSKNHTIRNPQYISVFNNKDKDYKYRNKNKNVYSSRKKKPINFDDQPTTSYHRKSTNNNQARYMGQISYNDIYDWQFPKTSFHKKDIPIFLRTAIRELNRKHRLYPSTKTNYDSPDIKLIKFDKVYEPHNRHVPSVKINKRKFIPTKLDLSESAVFQSRKIDSATEVLEVWKTKLLDVRRVCFPKSKAFGSKFKPQTNTKTINNPQFKYSTHKIIPSNTKKHKFNSLEKFYRKSSEFDSNQAFKNQSNVKKQKRLKNFDFISSKSKNANKILNTSKNNRARNIKNPENINHHNLNTYFKENSRLDRVINSIISKNRHARVFNRSQDTFILPRDNLVDTDLSFDKFLDNSDNFFQGPQVYKTILIRSNLQKVTQNLSKIKSGVYFKSNTIIGSGYIESLLIFLASLANCKEKSIPLKLFPAFKNSLIGLPNTDLNNPSPVIASVVNDQSLNSLEKIMSLLSIWERFESESVLNEIELCELGDIIILILTDYTFELSNLVKLSTLNTKEISKAVESLLKLEKSINYTNISELNMFFRWRAFIIFFMFKILVIRSNLIIQNSTSIGPKPMTVALGSKGIDNIQNFLDLDVFVSNSFFNYSKRFTSDLLLEIDDESINNLKNCGNGEGLDSLQNIELLISLIVWLGTANGISSTLFSKNLQDLFNRNSSFDDVEMYINSTLIGYKKIYNDDSFFESQLAFDKYVQLQTASNTEKLKSFHMIINLNFWDIINDMAFSSESDYKILKFPTNEYTVSGIETFTGKNISTIFDLLLPLTQFSISGISSNNLTLSSEQFYRIVESFVKSAGRFLKLFDDNSNKPYYASVSSWFFDVLGLVHKLVCCSYRIKVQQESKMLSYISKIAEKVSSFDSKTSSLLSKLKSSFEKDVFCCKIGKMK